MNGTHSRIILVDTNIISYVFKKDMRGDLYKSHLENNFPTIAAQTFAELEALPLLNKWSEWRYKQLRHFVENEYTMLEVDKEICLKWAAIKAEMKKTGKTMDAGDIWIAATALTYGIPLVTHNAKHFVGVSGLTIMTEKE